MQLIETEADAVGVIAPLETIRIEKRKLVLADTLQTEPLKQWMGLNLNLLDLDARRRPYLEDGEHGIRAILGTRQTTNWDLRTCPTDVLRFMADAGLLDVRNGGFDLARKDAGSQWLELAVRYRSRGETEVLLIERGS